MSKERNLFSFRKCMMKLLTYRVITFVASDAGSGGGFSRITIGGGVLGGVGRSINNNKKCKSKWGRRWLIYV